MLNKELMNALHSVFNDAKKYRAGLYSEMYNLDDKCHNNLEKDIIKLFAKSLSLSFSPNNIDNPFGARIVLVESRSPDLSDFSDSEIELICESLTINLPVLLETRLNDILWVLKKDYKKAQKAVSGYIELYNLTFDMDSWTTCIDYMKRANIVAKQLGTEGNAIKHVANKIDEQILKINGHDNLFLSLSLIELQIKNNYNNYVRYIEITEILMQRAIENSDNGYLIDNVFQVKEQLYKKVNNSEEIKKNTLRKAKYHITRAENFKLSEGAPNIQNAIHHYEESILLLRKCGERQKEENVRRNLGILKKKALDFMTPVESSIDITDGVNKLYSILKNKSLKECLIELTMSTKIFSMQQLEENSINNTKKYFFSSFFSDVYVDEEGKTIINIPPLDLTNPQKDKELLKLHMYRELVNMSESQGMVLNYFLLFIRENFTVTFNDLDFIFKSNHMILNDRKEVFQYSIYLALTGKYYEAIHILAPQMENFFRNIAKECGGIVTTFENDKTEQAKTLSSVFEIPELVGAYDKNLLFTFKGLLNEKAGANFRNNIAHGILTKNAGNSYLALYFICVSLKILSWYSNESYTMTLGSMQKRYLQLQLLNLLKHRLNHLNHLSMHLF